MQQSYDLSSFFLPSCLNPFFGMQLALYISISNDSSQTNERKEKDIDLSASYQAIQ